MQVRTVRQVRRAVGVLAAVLVLAGTACGSDGSDAADDAGTEAPTATVPPDEPAPEQEPEAPEEPDDGAGEGEGTSAGDVDACAIVELLDIETLLGEPGTVVDDTSDLGASCQVDPVDEASRAGMRLTVEVERGPENYAQQKELLGVDTEVEGLGDEAFHTGPYLFALEGDTLAFLQVLQSMEDGIAADDAALEAAMATVLAELR